jgi:hypothetical protein
MRVSSNDPESYESPTPYEAIRIHAAAVYCSDGRIGEQMDDFIQQGLGLPRYDRVAVAGGPVCLAGHLLAFWEARGVEEQLRFLIGVHGLERVVLIAHEGCAYYRERLRLAPDDALPQQRRDLHKAAEVVRRMGPEASAWIATISGTRVTFKPVRV